MDTRTEIIVTARLILCSPRPSDLPILYKHVFTDVAVMRHAFAGQCLSFQQTKDFFEENFDRSASGTKLGVLVERLTAEVIGFAGLLPCDVLNGADHEMGFVLRRSSWGNGYATEIGKGQIEYGFSSRGYRRLLAQVSPENIASIAILKKLGMQLHTTIQHQCRGVRRIYVIRNLEASKNLWPNRR